MLVALKERAAEKSRDHFPWLVIDYMGKEDEVFRQLTFVRHSRHYFTCFLGMTLTAHSSDFILVMLHLPPN